MPDAQNTAEATDGMKLRIDVFGIDLGTLEELRRRVVPRSSDESEDEPDA